MPVELTDFNIEARAASQRQIDVAGSPLDDDVDEQIESATVTDRLTMADTFVIVFRDPDKSILERARCRIGERVRISTASTRDDAPALLIDGEVTSIEADYDSLGSRAIVRGYDYSHRLTSGRRSQVFADVKHSDVARTIANQAGLDADVDETSGTFKHIIQANQSDFEFLTKLAKQAERDFRVEGRTLKFKKPTDAATGPQEGDLLSQDPVMLVWNDQLLEFRGRISAVAQVADVKVRGWDVEKKQAVIGRADVTASNVSVGVEPADLARAVAGKTLTVVDRPVGSQEAADALARSRAEQVGSAAYEATFVAVGSPELRAGVAVSVSGVEPSLNGKWVVTVSRHEFGDDGGYRTTLECTGLQDRSLHGLVAGGLPGVSPDVQRIPGLVIAIVTNIDDPEELGRVKLKYPWLADEVETSWARVAAPGAGPAAGLVWLPEVGDEVLVGFEHGDISAPFVLGGLWNGQNPAPLGDELHDSGKNRRSGFVSRRGHKLVFFDSPQETGIALMSANDGYVVSLNETKRQLHVRCAGKLLIEAQSLEIKVDTTAKIEAGSALSLESSATTSVKGSLVKIN